MEIERKFLIDRNKLPKPLEEYSFHRIEQGYLCTEPVVRVRRQDEEYILTYKGKGMMVREEYNLPLTKEGYEHLLGKADGMILTKDRYQIPLEDGNTVELDVFYGAYEGLYLAEVEFETEERANYFEKPDWFTEEVTFDPKYHNSNMIQNRKV